MRAKLHLLEYSQRRSFQQAEGIIFLTHYARYTVQQRIGRLQSSQAVIPHGIAAEFRAAPRTAQPLGYFSLEKPFRIIYVSAITVYKHQWHVAEAVAQLRRAGYPVTLDLIGPAYLPALRHLQAVLRRIDPNQEFIRYVGPVDYCQLPNWYRQADAFVYASSCENLPIILLEAMAAGIPIACSNRKPMPDILGQGGIYFDPENVADIAIALQTLLADHRLRGQYAELAFEQSQAYTWDKCATDTFEFLAQTLRSHGNKL